VASTEAPIGCHFSIQDSGKEKRGKTKTWFLNESKAEWNKVFDNVDACVTPVLSWEHLESNGRKLIVDVNGEKQIRPAPLLSRTPAKPGAQEPEIGDHTEDILSEWLSPTQIDQLRTVGAINGAKKARL
jgi:crotonobetainyl-CoA:carnitine CoA-transferase CaiB-like acyl-CoA transferase